MAAEIKRRAPTHRGLHWHKTAFAGPTRSWAGRGPLKGLRFETSHKSAILNEGAGYGLRTAH